MVNVAAAGKLSTAALAIMEASTVPPVTAATESMEWNKLDRS